MSVFAVELLGEYCEPPFGLFQFKIRSTGTKAIRHTDCTIRFPSMTFRALTHTTKIIFVGRLNGAVFEMQWWRRGSAPGRDGVELEANVCVGCEVSALELLGFDSAVNLHRHAAFTPSEFRCGNRCSSRRHAHYRHRIMRWKATAVDRKMRSLIRLRTDGGACLIGARLESLDGFVNQRIFDLRACVRRDSELHAAELQGGLQLHDEFASRLEVTAFQANIAVAVSSVYLVIFAIHRIRALVAAAGFYSIERGYFLERII
jgi:hypothetical protein